MSLSKFNTLVEYPVFSFFYNYLARKAQFDIQEVIYIPCTRNTCMLCITVANKETTSDLAHCARADTGNCASCNKMLM